MKPLPRTLSSILWAGLALVMLYPLLWMFLSSFKQSNVEIFSRPFALPDRLVWQNYQTAIEAGNMGDYFINSLLVTALTAFAVTVTGIWAGFALSKNCLPWHWIWAPLFLVGLVLPVQSYVIPLMDLLEWLRVHDSLWALILPYTAQSLPLAVFLFAAYFRTLPAELEEAALMDGMSTFRFYTSILFPVAGPVVATVAVITCLHSWNEFLMAMLFILDPAMKTLPVGMIAFQQAHNTAYPALLAGLAIISIPALLLYALFNQRIMRGLTAGTVK